jgi:hypothetical protein
MRRLVLAAVLIAVLLVPASTASQAAKDATVWNIVALGDSVTTGEGDPTGLGWVGRYARLLRQKLGFKVLSRTSRRTESPAMFSSPRCDPIRELVAR